MTARPLDELLDLRDTAWMDDALCAQVDPELFFPELGSKDFDRARQVCANCPVAASCTDYALRRPDLEGIWAGMTKEQRRRERSRRGIRLAPVLEHGTRSMWAAKGCRCDPCVDAARAYDRAYRARLRAKRAA